MKHRATDEEIGIANNILYSLNKAVKAFEDEYNAISDQISEEAIPHIRLQWAYLRHAIHLAQLRVTERRASRLDSRPSWKRFFDHLGIDL